MYQKEHIDENSALLYAILVVKWSIRFQEFLRSAFWQVAERESLSSENDGAKEFDLPSNCVRRRFHLLKAVRSANGFERFEPC